MNIYQKINEVRKAVDYVQKDKRVGEGGYLAVTHDAVTALTRKHFIEQGVVIVPNLMTSASVLTGTTTAKGVPFIRYEAKYRFDVVNVDEPQDRFQVEIESHAMDQGDKAPGKALSYAKKYVVLKLLEIESGEEEEERPEQKRSRITPIDGAMERVLPDRMEYVNKIASSVIDCLAADMSEEAAKVFDQAELDTDEKVAVWSLFDRQQRLALRKTAVAKKAVIDKS